MKKTAPVSLLSILSLTFMLNQTLSAQYVNVSEQEFYELKEYFDRLNGPDYNLLNGRQYEPLNSGASHPYLNTDRYRTGRLVLNGEAYENITINYDIYDQQVILQVPDNSGLNLKVVLNREMIDRFTIDGLTFRKMDFPETGTSFVRVLGSGDISCLLRWEKILYRSMVSGNTIYKFSKQTREIWLQKEGRLYAVTTRSSFTGLFDKAYRKEIQVYLQREKIRFKKANEEELGDLMNFCTGLIHGG